MVIEVSFTYYFLFILLGELKKILKKIRGFIEILKF